MGEGTPGESGRCRTGHYGECGGGWVRTHQNILIGMAGHYGECGGGWVRTPEYSDRYGWPLWGVWWRVGEDTPGDSGRCWTGHYRECDEGWVWTHQDILVGVGLATMGSG